MKRYLWILGILALGVVIFSTLFTGEDASAYRERIADMRADNEAFLKNASNSPFNQYDITYRGLDYFPIDRDYRVVAKIQRLSSREYVTIQNSDGTADRYLRFAYLDFQLKGGSHRLVVLKKSGMGPMNQLLLAFADATSGDSTYGGGRYLELTALKGDQVMLDFNLAFNPYCAYAASFLCPLPPRENLLEVAIEAGEKDYRKNP